MNRQTENLSSESKLIIAGSGGQGILFLGRLICLASMLEGKNVTWFPSYGAEMRGGTANCTVIVSSELIGSPIVTSPDVMIILNSASFEKFLPRIKNHGELFYDSSLIAQRVGRKDLKVAAIPSSQIAGDLGNPRLSNMVLLGVYMASTSVISLKSIKKALVMTVPTHRSALIEKNLKAIEKGHAFVKDKKSNGQ